MDDRHRVDPGATGGRGLLLGCRKRGFPSRQSAKLELRKIRRKAAAGAMHRNEDRTYRCPVWGALHLTSSERGGAR
ncbi:MAG: hypothetical protein ACREQM_05570 [Candidatus Dormibacteraceae bacterium]